MHTDPGCCIHMGKSNLCLDLQCTTWQACRRAECISSPCSTVACICKTCGPQKESRKGQCANIRIVYTDWVERGCEHRKLKTFSNDPDIRARVTHSASFRAMLCASASIFQSALVFDMPITLSPATRKTQEVQSLT